LLQNVSFLLKAFLNNISLKRLKFGVGMEASEELRESNPTAEVNMGHQIGKGS